MAPAKSRTAEKEGGIERTHDDDLSKLEQLREKFPWFDHLMRMQERYGEQGGNHFAAGITYFSVLSMIPLLLITFALFGFILAGNEHMMDKVEEQILNLGTSGLRDTLQQVVDTAVERRNSIGIIGLLVALWTGLGWVGNLRLGVSEMWKIKIQPDNFVKGKLSDLLGLLGLLASLVLAFAITAIGSSGLTSRVLKWLSLDGVPGMGFVTWLVSLLVGLLANYLVFLWLLKFLPREKVPWRSVMQAAIAGAVAFEIIKQFGAIFISATMRNPAAATFGPVIAIMVLFYLIWRVVLYCSAWAATTEESARVVEIEAPGPAIIEIHSHGVEEAPVKDKARLVGAGAAAGAAAAGLVGVVKGLRGRRRR